LTDKGFDYVAYYNGAYEDDDSLVSLDQTGANSIEASLDYGIDPQTDTVYADSSYTDSLSALGATIKQAVGLGLSVMVRPLVDFVNPSDLTGTPYSVDEWRTYFNPGAAGSAGANAFFASYQTMILQEAQVAVANGATSLCIGTELDQITGPAYEGYWNSIIAALRADYPSLKLTYAADWDNDLSPWQWGGTGLAAGTGNLATQISFASELDSIGIDCYAPISDAANPTLAELVAGWTETPTDPTSLAVTGGQSLISYFESVAAAVGKPLIFTELGYENATDAASQPAGSSTNVVDSGLQAKLYQAFFEAWQQAGNSSLSGVYFWNWDPNASEVGPANGVNFSPQGLPAQGVAADWFGPGPELAIASAGVLTNQTKQTISGTIDASDAGLTVSIYDGSTLIGTATPAFSGSWTADVALLSTQGPQSITAQATDAAGNVGASNAVTFTLDTTAPSIATAAASFTSADVVTISGTSFDPVGVAGVEIFNGSTDLGAATLTGATGAWSFSTTLAPSSYVALTAEATDAAGNTASATLSVASLGSPLTAADAVGFSMLISATPGYQVAISDTLANIQSDKTAVGSLITAGHVSSLMVTGVTGRSYDAYEHDYDSGGALTVKKFFFGATGQAYSSYEYDFSPGNNFVGSEFFYTDVTGAPYTAYEYDYDGGGTVTRVDFNGVSGADYSAYEYDYVGGVFSGSKFTYSSVPAGASYSSYEVDYNQANAFAGDKFFFANVTGQSYTGEEMDFDANTALSRVVLTGIENQSYASLELDYSAGTYAGYKAFYDITGQSYTNEEDDVSASGSLEKVVYSGLSGTPYQTVEQDYSGGSLADTVYGYADVTGQTYNAYQVTDGANGNGLQETFDLNSGGHTLIALASGQTLTSLGNDKMTGSSTGSTTFALDAIYGADVITNFTGADTISLPTSEFASFTALTNAAVQAGANVVITAADGDTLMLKTMTTTTLAGMQSNFTFPV
jgi:hypothetical protein